MTNVKRASLLLLAVIGGAGALAYRAKAEKPPAQGSVPTLEFRPAEVTRPVLAPMHRQLSFSGPLVAPGIAIVRAQVVGTLLDSAVAEGQHVRAGQTLARMDLAKLATQLDDRSAGVELARATFQTAEHDHKANVGLAAQGFIAPAALRDSASELEVARARLQSAQAQLASTRLVARDAALVAPIAGIVAKRHALPGEKLSERDPVFTIVDLGKLELAGTVPSHEASEIDADQPVELVVEGGAARVKGRIDRIAPMAEAGTRAIAVYVALDNPDHRFRAGQYAEAHMALADTQPRLTIPLSAITRSSGQDHVWVIEKGLLVRRVVVTGRRDVASGRAEIMHGLTADAQLLSMRFDHLKEGVPARTRSAAAAAAPLTQAR